MQNDTSREGTSTNNICFAPSAIPKRLQQNGALQLASDKHVPLVLQGMAERAEQRGKQGWSLLWSFYYPSALSSLGKIHHLPPHFSSKRTITLGQLHKSISPSILTQTQHMCTAPYSRGYSREKQRKSVKQSGLSPDTGWSLRQSIAGICHAADFASRLLPLIATGFSSVCLVTS